MVLHPARRRRPAITHCITLPTLLAASLIVAATLVLPAAASADEQRPDPAPTFIERFEAGDRGEAGGGAWTVSTDEKTRGLRLIRGNGGEPAPGFHFKAVATEPYTATDSDVASAPWRVGVRPFVLRTEVVVDSAIRQKWFSPGVMFGLSTAPAGEMTDDDLSLTFAIVQEGVIGVAVTGEAFDLVPDRTRFSHKKQSRTTVREGGRISSVQWWNEHETDVTLNFEIRRDEDDVIHWRVRRADAPNDDPWWTGSWKMPKEMAAKPFSHVVVRRTPVLRVHISYAGFHVRGRIRSMQGWLPEQTAPATIVDSGTAGNGLSVEPGGVLRVEGQRLDTVERVLIAGEPAKVLTREPDRLTARVPDTVRGSASLQLVTAQGLTTDVPGGVVVGRTLESLWPREASVDGGGWITIEGGGFDPDVSVHVGDARVEELRRESPRRLRFRAPPRDKPGAAPVTVRGGDGEVFKGELQLAYSRRPELWTDREGLDDLREKFQLPAFEHYRKALLRLGKDEPRRGSDLAASPFLYRLTGDEAWLDQAIEAVESEVGRVDHSEFAIMSAIWMAQNYDLLFDKLSPELKRDMEAYFDRVVASYLRSVRGGAWWYHSQANPSNTIAVGAAGGGLAGLAVRHQNPDGRRAAELAAKTVADHYRAVRDDGAVNEGSLYWNYGLTHHLYLAHALHNTIGDTQGLMTREPAPLERNINFVHGTLGGFGGLIPFNDSQPWLTGAPILADLGSRFDQPLMRWLADRLIRAIAERDKRFLLANENAGIRNVLTAFLWRDRTPAPDAFPGVPTIFVLDSVDWGVLRNRGDAFKPEIVVGLKGLDGEQTHHAQPDQGSVTVDLDGVPMLIDPGYFRPDAEMHTLTTVDGVRRGAKKPAEVQAWEKGDLRVGRIDVTTAYERHKHRPRRHVRHVALIGDEAVVWLDDILPATDAPGEAVAWYQLGQPAELLSAEPDDDGPAALRVAGLGASARVELHGRHKPIKLSSMDGARHSWGWRRLTSRGRAKWSRVEAAFTVDPDQPLLSVVLREKPGVPAEAARVDREADRITVTLASGASVAFTRRDGAWSVVRP